jgi:hypothetical protein
LLADLTFQFGDLAVLCLFLPQSWKGAIYAITKLAPPAMQYVGIDFRGAGYLGNRGPISKRRTAASLNSFVNVRRDKVMALSPLNEI